ncbi:universal stress protein [Cellulomonas sp. ATA003]|uniref:universal stress protein n=1 Tax=Cellulomonas sp. ATA003 TaxID=3073064 RepID=UPI00287344E9|nr:universal stress protein [Cellulomonas sp. ATA003]WNB86959.1 universal stress protein [Cellulomonas sp. ATA003]
MRADGPVVIAMDGSPHSAQTLEWGLTAAELREADVVLARAYQEPREMTQWSWYPILDDLRFDTEAKQYLADTVDHATSRHPRLRITTRLLHGPEVPLLRDLTDDAQLLVVGARGHAGRSRIGRVAAHLAAHARCPVAVVRDVTDEAGPVVVGVDGSPSSLAAADVAAQEATLREVPLVVVHARPPLPAPYGTEGIGLLTPWPRRTRTT